MNTHLTIGDADGTSLGDTPKGISNRPETVTTVLRFRPADLPAGARPSRLGDMQEHLSPIEDRGEKKRTLVASTMERAELRKLADPEFTVSPRPTLQPLVVTNENDVPGAYWKPLPKKLKAGENVTGASLGNGGVTIEERSR